MSFHVAELLASRRSSGINVGLTPEQTVAVGESRVYRYYANDHKVGAALVSDYGGLGTGPTGLSAAIVVGPKDAQFRDSLTGTPTDVGVQVDVSAPGTEPYRDLTAIVSDNDAVIGQNFMPYPRFVEGSALLNGKAAPRAEDTGDVPSAYSSAAGDPPTVFTAAVGDRVVVHALGASSSEQVHGFSVGGLPWRRDMDVPRSEVVTIDRVGANVSLDFELMRGSSAARPGDYFVGDLRGPFTQAGLHGLLRVSTFNDAAPGTPRSLADLPGYVPPVAPPRSAAAPVAASAPGQSARPEPASTVVGEHRSDDRKNLRITSRTTSRRLGRVSTHEVTITNPNGVPVKLTHVVQCLPVGLRYVPRSTTGRITSAPRVGKCGRTSASRRFAATGPVSLSLTWSSAITVPANGKVTFRYMARMSRTR